MEDDQVDIRIVNMQNRIDALEHEKAVLKRDTQDMKMNMKNQMSRILRLEECEDLRDEQLQCLKDFIDKHLPTYIEHGGGHGGKIGVLDVPEAKK